MEVTSVFSALAVKPLTPIIKSSSRDQPVGAESYVTLNKSLSFSES